MSILVSKIAGSELMISGSFLLDPYDDQCNYRFRLKYGNTVIKTWGDSDVGLVINNGSTGGLEQVSFDHIETNTGAIYQYYHLQVAVLDQSFVMYNGVMYALELKR